MQATISRWTNKPRESNIRQASFASISPDYPAPACSICSMIKFNKPGVEQEGATHKPAYGPTCAK